MSDDFLKREMAVVIKASKRKRKLKIAGLFLCLLLSAIGLFWSQSDSKIVDDPNNKLIENTYSNNPVKDGSSDNSKTDQQLPASPASTQTPAQSLPSASQVYTPSPSGIDRAAFIADANLIIANTSQIVSLLNFSTSTPDSVKVDRIRAATSLDSKSSDVTRLRGRVNDAGISSGIYMEAVELAETGVSKISVGITFINYWAVNHSRVDDLNLGLGNVNDGSNTMLALVHKINSL